MIITLSAEGISSCNIDAQLFEVRRVGFQMQLEPQVFSVLLYLIQNRHRVVPRSELLGQLWPDSVVSDTTLSHCIMAARRAIGDSGRSQRLVRTYNRRGYRVVANVTVSNAVAPDSMRARMLSSIVAHPRSAQTARGLISEPSAAAAQPSQVQGRTRSSVSR